jgi:hypothetical protein
VRDWSLKGGFFLWEAAQFVKHLSRGIPFAWTAAVLEEWLIPGETQKIRCACRLLRQFRTDEAVLAFYQKAVDLGNREVWSEVAASVGTTGQAYVSQPGEPDPTLLAEIEVFQRLQAGTKNPAAQAFFQKRIEATRQAIQEMLEEEEEELLAVL